MPLPHMPEPQDSYWTPQWLFDELNAKYGPFDLDAAASAANAKCDRYLTEEDDALDVPWNAVRVWCNPPYTDVKPWCKKAAAEILAGRCRLVCLLLPANTAASWFHDIILASGAELHWIRGKVKFGGAKKSAMWPSVACVITLRGVLANKLGIISVLE